MAKAGRVRFFYKFILSYAIVFAIPVISLGFFSYSHFSGVLKTQMESEGIDSTQRIVNAYDIQITGINQMVLQLSLQPEMRYFATTQNWFDFYAIKRSISGNISTVGFISEAILYSPAENIFISNLSSYRRSMFFSKYVIDGVNEQNFEELLNRVKSRPHRYTVMTAASGSKDAEYIILATAFPYGAGKNAGAALLLIDKKTFDKLITTENNSGMSEILIFDSEYNLISETFGQTHDYGELKQKLAHQPHGQWSVELGGSEYYASHVVSELTDWHFITLSQMDEALAEIRDYNLFVALFSLAIIAAGAALIFLFMQINYSPVKKLTSLAKALTGVREDNGDEIAAVQKAILSLSDDKKIFSDSLVKKNAELRQYFFNSLLDGKITDESELAERAAVFGFGPKSGPFRVLVAGADWPVEQEYAEKLLDSAKMNCEDFSAFCSLYEGGWRIAIFLSCEKNSPGGELAIAAIIGDIIKPSGKKLTFGISREFGKIESIPKAFLEADAAYDYRHIVGCEKLIYFTDIEAKILSDIFYPGNIVDTLELYILNDNVVQFENTINNLLSIIEAKNVPLFAARCLCYDIINTMLRVSFRISDSKLNLENFPDIFSLSRAQKIDELYALTKASAQKVLEVMKKRSPCRDDKKFDEIMKFIKQNYTDPSFSIKLLANHFEMSDSSFSHYFKSKRKQTVSEVINRMRIEKAKELLSYTNHTINSIVEQVGYLDTSSFIRKFKAYVGMTPGEYRSIYSDAKKL